MGDDESVIEWRVRVLGEGVKDHEDRLRKVENAQARSAWLTTIVTPLVTAMAVILVQQVFTAAT